MKREKKIDVIVGVGLYLLYLLLKRLMPDLPYWLSLALILIALILLVRGAWPEKKPRENTKKAGKS